MTEDPDYFARFFTDVGEGSDLELVLRGHLWIEAELISTLEEVLPHPSLAEIDRLSFPQKVALVTAHGLIAADDKPAYNKLNAMRNKLAHNLHAQPTPQDAAALIAAMGKNLRMLMDATKGRDQGWPWKLRYAITSMCIQLQTERTQFKEHKRQAAEAEQRLATSAQRLLEPPNAAGRPDHDEYPRPRRHAATPAGPIRVGGDQRRRPRVCGEACRRTNTEQA